MSTGDQPQVYCFENEILQPHRAMPEVMIVGVGAASRNESGHIGFVRTAVRL
jgi:hypothetical protein